MRLTTHIRRAIDRVVANPALVLATVVAAVNGVTEQSWQAYGAAAGIALLRFAVSPVVDNRDRQKRTRKRAARTAPASTPSAGPNFFD